MHGVRRLAKPSWRAWKCDFECSAVPQSLDVSGQATQCRHQQKTHTAGQQQEGGLGHRSEIHDQITCRITSQGDLFTREQAEPRQFEADPGHIQTAIVASGRSKGCNRRPGSDIRTVEGQKRRGRPVQSDQVPHPGRTVEATDAGQAVKNVFYPDPLKASHGQYVSPSQLRPGDILLVDAAGVKAVGIGGSTGSTYSHAALYIGNGQMIEAISNGGVRQISVQDFCKDHAIRRIMVVRMPNPSQAEETKLVALAQQQIGKRYNYTGAYSSPSAT